ncbi:MAG: c-type cytochrome [Planctomyces sp.]|nr:c-type cytochrome [Planctomyces sp.]
MTHWTLVSSFIGQTHYSFIRALILTLACGLVLAPSARADNRSNSLLAIHDSGTLAACSNRDSGTVTIVSLPEFRKLAEVPVGLHPEGVAWIPGTGLLVCCVYGDDSVVVIDSSEQKIVQRVEVFDEPYAVVPHPNAKTVYVTLEYPGQVLAISTEDWTIKSTWPAGKMLRGLAISRNGESLFVTEYLTANLKELSTQDGKLLRTVEAASTDNLCRQVTLSPDDRKAYVTHIRSRVNAIQGTGSIFPYVGVVTLNGEKNGQRIRVPMDSFRGARVTANPWECAVSGDGQRVYVVFSGTNDLFVGKVRGDDYVELDYEAALRLGNNPRAVRVTPDDAMFIVYNALDFELVGYSTKSGEIAGRCTVTENPLGEEVLLGKKLFYSALQPLSSRNWISCSSCHPDGDSDGRTWQQPEGLRQTQPMTGLAFTHPVHWSADRDEVQDFEHTIRGPLMQGQGLLKGQLPEALADPISGRSEMLDALAAYTNSHQFTLSPHSKNGLSESAVRGQKLFLSDRTGCAKCHSGPFYADSQPMPTDQIVRHNVGTGNDDPSEKMAPEYDTPTLLGLYRSAPYLHHGKAATLKEVLTTWNKSDQHGRTSDLSESEINDLVEFMNALPFEDPVPAAEAAGLKKVVK